jgi:mannose-6-phosphate isomerase-like protein (cupin superfamily)
MPYVSAAEGLNEPFFDLTEVRMAMGQLPGRAALIGTSGLRVVLLHWPPGYQTVPHYHPHADEIFIPLEGRAVFTIGEGAGRDMGPGQLAFAPSGTWHTICVPPDGEPLVLLAAVAPNENLQDETVE